MRWDAKNGLAPRVRSPLAATAIGMLAALHGEFMTPPVASAQLKAGDVAIVAYNSDRDDFAWVALRDIPSNTVIHFTDSSVSNACFRWSEHLGDLWAGPLTWSHTNTVAAGTVIRWTVSSVTNWSLGQKSGGRPMFSTDGDQIFVYTGSISSNVSLTYPWRGDPTNAAMVFGINFANGGWDNVTGGEPNNSFIPSGLSSSAFTAVHIDGKDDGYYRGPYRGMRCQLLEAIANRANWTTGNDPFDQTNWVSALEVQEDEWGAVFMMH